MLTKIQKGEVTFRLLDGCESFHPTYSNHLHVTYKI